MSEQQNVKKGGKRRKRMKNHITIETRELQIAEDGQLYAVVDRALGNGRLYVTGTDSVRRLAHIRAALKRKKVIIEIGDTVLVTTREFETEISGKIVKCDVVLRYDAKEVALLRRIGELSNAETVQAEDDTFDFAEI